MKTADNLAAFCAGYIAKINQKSIDVRTAQGIWRVGASLLKRA
jgi:hypothetical protein